MRNDVRTLQTPSQFPREQNVAEFGIAIGPPLTVPLVFMIQIVQTKVCHPMCHGCGIDDPTAFGRLDQGEEGSSHIEVTKVVYSKSHLIALSG